MAGADVLVLGAGSAGSVVAARLSEDPVCRVHLVEAGDWPRDPDIADPLQWPFLEGRDFDWAYRTVAQPGTAGRVHAWPRGRVVGGSSCMHAMAHVQGHADDFAPWAEAAGPRWSQAGLARGFGRCALPQRQDRTALSPVAAAFIEAGQAIGAPMLASHKAGPLAGATVNTLTIRDGRRVSVADAYLAGAVRRPNLTISTGAVVERLAIEQGRVRGAVIRQGGASSVAEADRVVLCLGTIGSPLLLLRSGIGDAEQLRSFGIACAVALPAVGRNLHDHLLAAGNVYAARRAVPRSRLQHSESLMYLHGDDPARVEGAPDCVLACVVLPAVTECFAAPAAGSAYTIMFGFTHPTSRGSIMLTGADAVSPPRIDPAYLSTEADRRAFRRGLELAREVGHAAPLDDWRDREILPGVAVRDAPAIEAFLARAARTHHHPVGTCAMGAVVDADLRVQGLENLFVVDASVIPRITTGPVNAAVVAIAETWTEAVGAKSIAAAGAKQGERAA
ncbi:MAG TPA: GMC oxidoreductase [Acetobacteraceae bacterium]|nr:GMC oxidoreductase [Acetobacteraceae bacterium]